MLLVQVKSKFPGFVIRHLEMMKKCSDPWTLKELRNDLHTYIWLRESTELSSSSLEGNRSDKLSSKETNSSNYFTAQALFSETTNSASNFRQCIFCKDNHWSDQCKRYATLNEKKQQIKGRCFNCLRKTHSVKSCKVSKPCVYCSRCGNHHRSLCPKEFLSKEVVSTVCDSSTDNSKVSFVAATEPVETESLLVSGEQVLMQTATAEVLNMDHTKFIKARIFFDRGSQRS